MTAGSTIPRRMLGRRLKQLRERSGVSQAAACRAIEIAPQTLWRIETGQPGPKLKDIYVDTLCRLYSAPEDDAAVLIGLVAETKSPGWWHAYGDAVPTDFDLYLGLEEAACRLTTFQIALLPGLLQTADYRRAMIWATFPSMPTVEVERRIELALKRQVRLRETPGQFSIRAYLSEAALRHRVGGSAVMADQLHHLVAASQLPTVALQVVPLTVEMPMHLVAGSFTLLEFPSHPTSRLTEPPVVYVEGYTGALYLDKPGEIDRYKLACKAIRAAALSEHDSRQLILDIAREFE
ncbi:helix-turn-helix domain-containing protein [Nocardia miyunensis]|uniref:helix-turn-helix domain-containing protein n=1 Tax=Nocardia miyunensis TaxID=282684 RepID=UPI0008365186